jgi:hypothetical protein
VWEFINLSHSMLKVWWGEFSLVIILIPLLCSFIVFCTHIGFFVVFYCSGVELVSTKFFVKKWEFNIFHCLICCLVVFCIGHPGFVMHYIGVSNKVSKELWCYIRLMSIEKLNCFPITFPSFLVVLWCFILFFWNDKC